MRRLLYAIGLAAITTAVFTSCGDNSKKGSTDNPAEKRLPMEGSWRYVSMTYIVPGDRPDTSSIVFGPDTIQIYDIYRHDSILESYLTLGDSILYQTQMHYIFRNDSIIAENDERTMRVHVANATDSTLSFDYIRTHGDTTIFFKTQSERCELPRWLKETLTRAK